MCVPRTYKSLVEQDRTKVKLGNPSCEGDSQELKRRSEHLGERIGQLKKEGAEERIQNEDKVREENET